MVGGVGEVLGTRNASLGRCHRQRFHILTFEKHLATEEIVGCRKNLEEGAETNSPDAKSDSETDEDSEAHPQSDSKTDEDSEDAGEEELGKLESGDTCDFTEFGTR